MLDVIVFLSRLAVLIPKSVLEKLFPLWPISQLLVFQRFIRSPVSVHASLSMAHDEMRTIRDLDISQLKESHRRLWMYFAERDDWVGEQRESILQAFDAGDESVNVVHGHRGIPHAFCISECL
jgi:Lipid-droplet associated hydrolase